MRSNAWVGSRHSTDVFAVRASPRDLPELMDDCSDAVLLRGCLRNLAFANRLTGSYRPTLRFLRRALARHSGGRTLRIVDVGSGYGDMLRRVARWAARRRLPLELTGVDLNPLATRIATEADAGERWTGAPIHWRTGDAARMNDLNPDLVISSLLMHHLEDEEIVTMVRWMESTARVGWFINDLERQRTPSRLWTLLARALRWHPFLLHDGPVSFRRAFRLADWERLLQQAGLPRDAATVDKAFPARLCVSRVK